MGRDHLTGLAPFGPEIDQDRRRRLENFRLEGAVGDGNGMCHGVLPPRRGAVRPRARLERSLVPEDITYNAWPLVVFPHALCRPEARVESNESSVGLILDSLLLTLDS